MPADPVLFDAPPPIGLRALMRGRDPAAEIIVDGFAGGGGTSEGIRMALGRSPDEALNHDPAAVSMHWANHPDARHHCQNIWQADPAGIAGGRPIGLAWFSPACTHFSKAKGGAPLKRNIRDLAWIVVAYARLPPCVRPRVVMVENVEEFRTWGPLGDDDRPIAARRGETFEEWVRELRRLGYAVEWRESRASSYGAPTIRKRLCVVARCDGRPIVWPAPTHGDPRGDEVRSGSLLPWRAAAEIIDWSLPCPSIFLTREEARAIGVKRPLEESSLRRIFAGLRRHVIEAENAFVIPITHSSNPGGGFGVGEPLRTITTARGGEFALVAPHVSVYRGASPGRRADEPLGTITCAHSDHHPGGAAPLALVCPTITKFNQNSRGDSLDDPLGAAMAGATRFGLVAAWMTQHNGARDGANPGRAVADPLSTITATGANQMLATASVEASGDRSEAVRAFLIKYYGSIASQDVREPLHTISTLARFGLVAVRGEIRRLTDLGMRMLAPRELFSAQGFSSDYVIDTGHDGRRFSKAQQIHMCGNSVSPNWAAAHVAANVPELARDARTRRAVG